jgi:hypothetical protein
MCTSSSLAIHSFYSFLLATSVSLTQGSVLAGFPKEFEQFTEAN